MATITKAWNQATVTFRSPDTYTDFVTLVNDFLKATGQYANTLYKTLYIKVEGGNPTAAYAPASGDGSEANPYVYFNFDSTGTTRNATVVIDWGNINLSMGYSDSSSYVYLMHRLAAGSTIRHINLDVSNSCAGGQTCNITDLGTVIFENSKIFGGIRTAGSNSAALLHVGNGTVQLINCEVTATNSCLAVTNKYGGILKAANCKFANDSDTLNVIRNGEAYSGGEMYLQNCTIDNTDPEHYQGISIDNISGLVNLDGCTVLTGLNQDRAELCNCRLKGQFVNENYARLTHCNLTDTFKANSGKSYLDNCRIFISEAKSAYIAGVYVGWETSKIHLSNTHIEIYNRGGDALSEAYGIFIYNPAGEVRYRDIYAQNCVITAGSSKTTTKAIGINDVFESLTSRYIRITLMGCSFPEPEWGYLGDNVSVGFPAEEGTLRRPYLHIQGCKFSKSSIYAGTQAFTSSTQADFYMPANSNLFNVTL